MGRVSRLSFNDGQSRGTRERPTKTGQGPKDRHSQAEPGNENNSRRGYSQVNGRSPIYATAMVNPTPAVFTTSNTASNRGLPGDVSCAQSLLPEVRDHQDKDGVEFQPTSDHVER